MSAIRMAWQNYVHMSGVNLYSSSADAFFPVRWLLDPLKTKRWRSKVGWQIIAGFNDDFDFSEGVTGDATATLTAGNYATGAALATELQTQLNAAATDNTYTVTYDTSTKKFTVARATGTATISLEWSTGANAATSCGRDLGFDTSADDTGATTYTGDYAVYQSRQYVEVDLGTARSALAAFLTGMQTLTANGVIRVQANSSRSWSSPAYNQSVGTAYQVEDRIIHWPASAQNYRYWRIMVDDPFQASGYSEIGLLYLGGYLSIGGIRPGFENSPAGFSLVQVGDMGGVFSDAKASADRMEVDLPAISVADKASLKTMWDAIGAKAQFVAFNPTGQPLDVRYLCMMEPPGFKEAGAKDELYDTTLVMQEQKQ